MKDALRRENWAAWAAGSAVAMSVCSIAAAQILLGVAVLLTVVRWRQTHYPRGTRLLLVFFVLTLVSAAFSGYPAAAIPQVRKFYVFLIVPCVATAYAGPAFVRAVFAGIGALGGASAFWGLWQYFHKWSDAQDAGVNFTQAYIASRITGFMSHWMTFGAEMMVVLLLTAAYLLFAIHADRRFAGLLLLAAVALFLAWTRGVWIGTFAGVLYLLWFWRRWLVLAAPFALAALVLVLPQPEKDRVISIVKPRPGDTDSNAHRVALFRTGIVMIGAHPLLGVGPERVEKEFERYAPADIARPFPRAWWYGHLHNIYVQYAAERGIPAMLCIIGFIVWTLWNVARAAVRAPAETAWMLYGMAAVMVGILVTGGFEHSLGDSEILQLTLGLLTLGGKLAEDAVV